MMEIHFFDSAEDLTTALINNHIDIAWTPLSTKAQLLLEDKGFIKWEYQKKITISSSVLYAHPRITDLQFNHNENLMYDTIRK